RERRLVFNDVPLAEVVKELNRYWPGKLVLMSETLGRRRVQAQFSLDRLSDATALIRDVYGADVTELPGGVVMLRSPSA
ncbi:MAG TPA: iron dicitrate transport regulator FecR, partial [Pusillimonas sp.]|nr:iron dicitrate transport regulator FecR [Pusillimonas sp.]